MNQSTGQGQTTIYTEEKMLPNLLFVSHLFLLLYIGPVSKPIIVSSCKFMVLPLIKIQGFALCCFPRAAVEVSDVGNAVVATIGRSGGLYQLLV